MWPAMVTTYQLPILLSYKQNYVRGWGQQCVYDPKEK